MSRLRTQLVVFATFTFLLLVFLPERNSSSRIIRESKERRIEELDHMRILLNQFHNRGQKLFVTYFFRQNEVCITAERSYQPIQLAPSEEAIITQLTPQLAKGGLDIAFLPYEYCHFSDRSLSNYSDERIHFYYYDTLPDLAQKFSCQIYREPEIPPSCKEWVYVYDDHWIIYSPSEAECFNLLTWFGIGLICLAIILYWPIRWLRRVRNTEFNRNFE